MQNRSSLRKGFVVLGLLAASTLAAQEATPAAVLANHPQPQNLIASANRFDGGALPMSASEGSLAATSSSKPFAVPVVAIAPAPVPVKEKESDRNKKIWYALTLANHSAAAFDAYSTRYAVSRGEHEVNPTLRPFADSNWIYPVMQASAMGLDYVSHRMMHSKHTALRKLWWLPQSANAVSSFAAGAHNLSSAR